MAFLGIPAQAVLGGITVLTGLNPWIVGAHFLLSMAVIAVAYAFWVAAREGDGPVVPAVPGWLRGLAALLVAVSATVLVVGTVVTGSGPHAGDPEAGRNGLNPDTVSQLHVDLVFLLIGLSVAMWFALRAVGAEKAAVRAAWLIAVELAQGLVGFVQHFTNLPPLVVAVHMAGACAVWIATLALWHATRIRLDTSEPVGEVAAGRAQPHGRAKVATGHERRRVRSRGPLLPRTRRSIWPARCPSSTKPCDADEPVLVAVPTANLKLLTDALGGQRRPGCDDADASEVGRNPGRLIPVGVLRASPEANPDVRVST